MLTFLHKYCYKAIDITEQIAGARGVNTDYQAINSVNSFAPSTVCAWNALPRDETVATHNSHT